MWLLLLSTWNMVQCIIYSYKSVSRITWIQATNMSMHSKLSRGTTGVLGISTWYYIYCWYYGFWESCFGYQRTSGWYTYFRIIILLLLQFWVSNTGPCSTVKLCPSLCIFFFEGGGRERRRSSSSSSGWPEEKYISQERWSGIINSPCRVKHLSH